MPPPPSLLCPNKCVVIVHILPTIEWEATGFQIHCQNETDGFLHRTELGFLMIQTEQIIKCYLVDRHSRKGGQKVIILFARNVLQLCQYYD